MAYRIPYNRDTLRIPDKIVPGNSTDPKPVEFDLVPAEGADLARLRSILHATGGLADAGWSDELQRAVIAAFETGAPVFASVVADIRNLAVPAALALRVGLISLPREGEPSFNPDAEVAIKTGGQFAKVCGFVPAIGFQVAMAVIDLSMTVPKDPRLFTPASGSGGPGNDRSPSGTAGSAPASSGASATAASSTTPADASPGTSPSSPSS